MEEVQSYISNISFPKTLEEFIYFLEDDFHFNVDDILTESSVEWNAPRWCKIGDIVFFMHAKTAISIITKLRSEYIKNKALYTKSKQVLIEKGIEHAIDDYKKYGGKIFAIGRVIDSTMYDDFYRDEVELHWKGRIYAPIGDIIILENPIDISEFNDFIFISRQSSITGVFGKEFEQLKILQTNPDVKKLNENIVAIIIDYAINDIKRLKNELNFIQKYFNFKTNDEDSQNSYLGGLINFVGEESNTNLEDELCKSLFRLKYIKTLDLTQEKKKKKKIFNSKDKIKIMVVNSDHSGIGKSTFIKNQIKEENYIYFPIGGIFTKENTLIISS